MLQIPPRQSLVTVVATAIRQNIEDGEWKEFIPGERQLCRALDVSRPTVRAALVSLANAGWISRERGRRRRIERRTDPQQPLAQSRQIVLVMPEPLSHLPPIVGQGIEEMRARLAENGIAVEMLVCPGYNFQMQRRRLAGFLRRNQVLGCVLLSVTRELQHWVARCGIPALVLGYCLGQVKLPSLDVDHRLVCRHAAGILLGKGHRRMALVMPRVDLGGYLASEQGFREAVEQSRYRDGRIEVVRHNGTAVDIVAHLDRLFASSTPPTALLVVRPQYVFVVIMYLLKRGITVPHQVSLIARDENHLFEVVDPPITHYRFEDQAFGRALTRLMMRMIRGRQLPPVPHLIRPEYFAGGTVARCR